MSDKSKCPCGGIILADTEDWETPLCFSCYSDLLEINQTAKSRISDLEDKLEAATRKVDEFEREVERLKHSRSAQINDKYDAYEENAKLKALLGEAVEALKGFYECTMCKTRTETKWGRSCSVIDGVCLWRKVDHTGLIAKLQEVTK